MPVSFTGDNTLIVAMVDPANVLAIDDIAVMTGYEVRPAVSRLADVERLLARLEDPDFGHGAVAPEDEDGAGFSEPAGPRPPRRPPRSTTCARTPRSTSAPVARTRRSSNSSTG